MESYGVEIKVFDSLHSMTRENRLQTSRFAMLKDITFSDAKFEHFCPSKREDPSPPG